MKKSKWGQTPFTSKGFFKKGVRPLLVFAFLFFVLHLPSALYACPSCMEAIASQTDPAAVRLLKGYAWSVGLMMAAPYLLFALITFLIVRRRRHLPLKRGS